ncbi:MAG TPA: hypothetical protein VNS08_15455 [Ureibacillus sp.]|nr:hypothetical protein [Ureibacillus sp.]
MADSRKKIILNEILFWKQNKLLPEQYCDFLITLYSEGKELELEQISHKKSIKAKQKQKKIILCTVVSILVIALLLSLFLVSKMTWIVGIIVGITAIFLMISAYRFSRKKEMIAPILHIASALLLLGLSVKISIEYFPENQIVLYSFLIINCLLWFFTGYKYKLMYFTVSGILGAVVIIGYQFMNL